jgi:hypothetical protein
MTSAAEQVPLGYLKKVSGKAALPTKAAFRAQINIMFESLTRLGMSRPAAGKLLEGKLKREGVKENGANITSKAIMRWHGEIRGKSLSGSDKVYRKLKADLDRDGWPSFLYEGRARLG